MATRMCDVCGIRPAVVTVRRVVPGEGQRVEHLCEIHAAEAGPGVRPSGADPHWEEEAYSTTSSAGSSTKSPEGSPAGWLAQGRQSR